MTGQNIWHIKTRKPGGAEFKFAETQHQPREPRDREVIEVGIGGKIVRAKIMTIHGSHSGATVAACPGLRSCASSGLDRRFLQRGNPATS